MAFSLNSQVVNNVARITLVGELDANSAAQFRAAIDQAATSGLQRLVLVMNDLEYMASAGLRALVFARQKMGPNVDIYCIGVRDRVRETIEMTGFQHSVFLADSEEATGA